MIELIPRNFKRFNFSQNVGEKLKFLEIWPIYAAYIMLHSLCTNHFLLDRNWWCSSKLFARWAILNPLLNENKKNRL